jgi:hypothetical protein
MPCGRSVGYAILMGVARRGKMRPPALPPRACRRRFLLVGGRHRP